MKNPFLIGDSVYLRPLEREDAAIFVPWVNDQEISRTLLLYRPMNRDNEEDFVARAYKDQGGMVFGIALKKDDRLIGNTRDLVDSLAESVPLVVLRSLVVRAAQVLELEAKPVPPPPPAVPEPAVTQSTEPSLMESLAPPSIPAPKLRDAENDVS